MVSAKHRNELTTGCRRCLHLVHVAVGVEVDGKKKKRKKEEEEKNGTRDALKERLRGWVRSRKMLPCRLGTFLTSSSSSSRFFRGGNFKRYVGCKRMFSL